MFNSSRPQWQMVKCDRGSKISWDLNTLWLIQEGIVKVFTYDLSGRVVILGYWGKGDVIGQTSNNFNFYEIECLSAVKLATVPYQDWHYIAKEIRSCFQDSERLIYALAQKNIEEKLLEVLIYFGDKFGQKHELGKAIVIPLTHNDLSQLLNITRVSVTRSMNRLQTKNYIVNPKRGEIVLRTSEIPRLAYKI